MSKLFNASGHLSPQDLLALSNQNIDFANLPPFLRVLLSTDGTVTKSLEAFFWETVNVENCGQSSTTLTAPNMVIQCHKGEQVLLRHVTLRGSDTGTLYAKASSLICTKRLPKRARDALMDGVLGIGEMLRECGLETYREIVAIGSEAIDEQTWIWRRYKIDMAKQVVMQITEHFPLRLYAS